MCAASRSQATAREVLRLADAMPAITIDTTVLVHELYLEAGSMAFENQAHLLAHWCA